MTLGVLSLNKDPGMTSFDAVREVRKIFHERKVGHAGTLDPIARGLLPICIGQATRLVDYFHAQTKAYRCTVRFGFVSETLDTESELQKSGDATALTADLVTAQLAGFIGDIEQIPPMHSAVRHQGQHLYTLARAGVEVERKPRPVHIESIELLEFRNGEVAEADLLVTCGKGVYVRTLAADLGEKVGTGGVLAWLERSKYGPLDIADAHTLAELREMDDPTQALLPPAVAVEFMPRVDLAPQLATKLQRGQSVWVPKLPAGDVDGECRAHGPRGDLLAVGELQGNLLKPTRVFASN